MIDILIFIALTMLQTSNPVNPCTCTVTTQEPTRPDKNMMILATWTRLRVAKGTVTDTNHQPVPNALVEAFTDPEVLTLPSSPEVEARRTKRRRVVACLTDREGKFCFATLPAGKYELRSSAKGFRMVSQTLEVATKGPVGRQVSVLLVAR